MKHILMIFFIAGLSALGCSSSPEKNDGGWDIVLSGKVGFPSSGQITIQRMQPDGLGWKDTIVLKSNFSYAKKIRLTEPGYYQLNFYDRQRLNLILAKTSIEVNVDGNNPNGFAEIKGSPDHDLITKVQTLAGEAQNTPEIAALTKEEKEQIIKHEITHATKLHSIDILLVEFLKVIFWFNPAVYYLKSLITSIHEFKKLH